MCLPKSLCRSAAKMSAQCNAFIDLEGRTDENAYALDVAQGLNDLLQHCTSIILRIGGSLTQAMMTRTSSHQ